MARPSPSPATGQPRTHHAPRAAFVWLLVAAAKAAAEYDPTTVPIAPGVNMPLVNLGGVPAGPSNYTDFLNSGGRGLDTALTYGKPTQEAVGTAVKNAVAAGMDRSSIFVTTKVPCCPGGFGNGTSGLCMDFPNATLNVELDIDQLGGPVDLILLHWPCATIEQSVLAYRTLENALKAGKTRAIGVSNFNASQLEQFLPKVDVKPAVNQCDHGVGHHNSTNNPELGADDMTMKFCVEHGISYSAYSPLGGLSGIDIFHNPTVLSIAKVHNVSGAQIALRWLIQQGVSVVTAANKHEYIAEDLDVFSFSLTANEMARLAAL